jgi:plasmid stabilization system protein ParE
MGFLSEELPGSELRELVVDDYRIIYRCRDKTVEVLTVVHGARILRSRDLESG